MARVAPLRGEGRLLTRLSGGYGELLSEFLGTLVLVGATVRWR